MKNYLFTFFTILFSLLVFQISNAQTPFFTETFETGAIPTGWTQITKASDGGWRFGTNTTLQESQYFPIPSHTKFACTNDAKCQCDKSNDMLITSAIDLSSYTKLQMSLDEFYYGGDYNGYVESAFVKATINDGQTWIELAEILPAGNWFNQIVDLTPVAGNNNVKFAFVYSDDGGTKDDWLYGLAIDNVKIYVPSDYDMASYSIRMKQCFRSGDQTITGWMINKGATTINTMTINYQIDSDPVVSENLTNLNLKSTDFYNFTFSTPWNATVIGSHTLKIWASNLNGEPDQATSNDIITDTYKVFKAGKPVLVEFFTNASCGPCAYYEPFLNSALDKDNDFVLSIGYHKSWPGVDPMNASNKTDVATRVTYYNVTGTPTAISSGALADGLMYEGDECEIATSTGKPVTVNIDNATATLAGTSLSFSADIVPTVNISGNYKAHIAIIEEEITFAKAPGTNGQKVFRTVMRKMYPDANGKALPSTMNAGVKQTVSGTWTLANIYDKTKLRVVFFVQNTSTKEVIWAALASPNVGIHDNNEVSINGIFPNPVNNEANIYFNLTKPENVNIRIFNNIGEQVFSENLGFMGTGRNDYSLNVENLNAGMYFIEINNGHSSSTRKFSVIK